MTKTYKSSLGNLTVCGITFRMRSGGRGSYHTTSDGKEQKMLEGSPLFGSVFRLERQHAVETKRPSAAVTEERKEEPANGVFMTNSLQEARQIIMNIRAERGLPAKNMPNAKSMIKAAQELGVRFPNIKVK